MDCSTPRAATDESQLPETRFGSDFRQLSVGGDSTTSMATSSIFDTDCDVSQSMTCSYELADIVTRQCSQPDEVPVLVLLPFSGPLNGQGSLHYDVETVGSIARAEH